MIVCICRRVSDRDIAHAAKGGCASFDELQFELGVGTGCGACGDCARDIFHHTRSALAGDIAIQATGHPAAVCAAEPA